MGDIYLSMKKYITPQIAKKNNPVYKLVKFFRRSFLIISLYKIQSINITKKASGIIILIGPIVLIVLD